MAYKIIDVEGIGPVYAEKLQTAGIKTTEEYLEKCATPAGRKALAEATDISPKLILKRHRQPVRRTARSSRCGHCEGVPPPRGS